MPFDALNADDVEGKGPNGPILVNADDIRLVIPKRRRRNEQISRDAHSIKRAMTSNDVELGDTEFDLLQKLTDEDKLKARSD